MKTEASVKNNNRIETLDYLRGFALLGIIFINIGQMVFATTDKTAADAAVNAFMNIAVSHRFFVIFSFLFGVGFYLFVSRAKERGDRAMLLFTRRLLLLLAIGLAHHFFQPGEALLIYSILGFLLMPFFKLKPAVVFLTGFILTIAGCFTVFLLEIWGLFLLGLWAGQIGLFRQTDRYRRGLLLTMTVSFLFLVPSYYVQEEILERTGMVDVALAAGGLSFSVFYVTALTLILRSRLAQRLLAPLNYLGRMALTNYLMQTVMILSLSALFNWPQRIHSSQLALTAAGILLIQMAASTWWFRYFRMGPAEYVWRLGTYGKKSVRHSSGMSETTVNG
ncbi:MULTISPECIES: DUF418 domain-containing protein [unclassified Paenibacillus]|uniref:DUF418 domain-containing protein n=1 Tax=unclassified Paenibacillus TaxID=185978 RepID=UPI00020D7F04|nr:MULTISPECIES: DUF418 domain-containing protein [unclassified Paenibacillus]EGL17776.1 hypothetical protein HMPREF9413_4317 [Paenibacillus sp. HGF7]